MARYDSFVIGAGTALALACAIATAGCQTERKEPKPMPTAPGWKLTSTAFEAEKSIPTAHTCDGADLSPPLSWTAPPAGTRQLALVLDDPDAPVGLFTHWLLYGLPAEVTSLPQGVAKQGQLPQADFHGARQGRNDFRRNNVGYSGPCPPRGSTHRYYFTLYALDAALDLKPELDRKAFDRAVEGHVVAVTQLMGRFGH